MTFLQKFVSPLIKSLIQYYHQLTKYSKTEKFSINLSSMDPIVAQMLSFKISYLSFSKGVIFIWFSSKYQLYGTKNGE